MGLTCRACGEVGREPYRSAYRCALFVARHWMVGGEQTRLQDCPRCGRFIRWLGPAPPDLIVKENGVQVWP